MKIPTEIKKDFEQLFGENYEKKFLDISQRLEENKRDTSNSTKMNNKGQEYLKCANILKQKLEKLIPIKYKKFYQLNYSWEDSIFQERLMRLGIEYKVFNLEITDTKEIEQVVNASLIFSLSFLLKKVDWNCDLGKS